MVVRNYELLNNQLKNYDDMIDKTSRMIGIAQFS